MSQKISYFSLSVFFLLAVVVCLGLNSCANIIPPSGGEKDVTPPKLLSETPGDSSLNKEVYKINLVFNKFMEVKDLQKNLVTSPLLPMAPTVKVFGKRVQITLPDSSLKPNTTYRLFFGNALTDNREQTPYANYSYLFSTGSYFDSLEIKGQVWDAETGLPDSTAYLVLYDGNSSDSVLLRKRPEYVQKVRPDGRFVIGNLPNRAFKIYALGDNDQNFIYNRYEERVDFYDRSIRPGKGEDSLLYFFTFKEDPSKDSLYHAPSGTQKEEGGKDRFGSGPSKVSRKSSVQSQQAYVVLVDTLNQEKGAFDLTDSLEILLSKRLEMLDTQRVYLSYEDEGIEVEAPFLLRGDSLHLWLKHDWKSEKRYTLRLIKGWAVDTGEVELVPGKFAFRTKSKKEYAELHVKMDSVFISDTAFLVLKKGNQIIQKKQSNQERLTFPLLTPGEYTMSVFYDANGDGVWTTGDLFQRRHAEKVVPYSGKVILKAGWVNDVDFEKPTGAQGSKGDRFNEKK